MKPRHYLVWGFLALVAALPAWGYDDERPKFGGEHYRTAARVECSFLIAWHTAFDIEYPNPVVDPEELDAFLVPAQKLYGWGDDRRLDVAMAAQTLAQQMADVGFPTDFRLINDDAILAFVRSTFGNGPTTDDFAAALQILKLLPHGAFRWGQPLLSQGPLDRLREVVDAAGVFGVDAQPALLALESVKPQIFSRAETQRIAALLSREEDPPIVCVTGGKSRLSPASHAAAYYKPIPTRENPAIAIPRIQSPPIYPRSVPETGIPRLTEFIVLSPPNRSGVADPLRWASYVVHELTHWHDYRVLSAWVRANQRRINRGFQPDTLFRAYVRIERRDGQFIVILDDRFLVTFLESRAYAIEADVYEQLLPGNPSETARHNEGSKTLWQGYNYVKSRVGSEVLEALGVTAGGPSFFQLGRDVLKQMEMTMRLAGVPMPR